jgi:Ca-activated chloride channel family protein
MISFVFAHPHFLWFLLLAPLFVFIHFISLNYNKSKALPFANFQAIERFYNIEFFSKNFIALYFQIFILILIILGLAGMSVSFDTDTSSNSFVIAIDSSGSMTAQDISPSRFDVAKQASKNFVNDLPIGVNVGVIGFSGDALIYQNLVNDKNLIKSSIGEVEIGRVEGTNIYNAIITANQLFNDKNDGKGKSVILMSDGQINVGDAPLIIDYAKENEIILHTLAIGTSEGGLTSLNVVSKADSDFLKSLSFNTGGYFFEVGDINSFKESYSTIVEKGNFKVTLDITPYLLIAALMILLFYWISYSLKFKSFP